MLTFMMILIPASAVLFLMKKSDKAYVPVFVTGVISAVFVCILTALFSFLHRIPEYSFASNFSYFSLREYVLPLALLYIIYFFASKDELEFKLSAFFPLEAGFFSVFMPYFTIVSTSSAFSIFELFIKPVLVLSMILSSAFFVLKIGSSAVTSRKKSVILFSILLALSVFIPPFLNVLYLLSWLKILFYVTVVLFACFAFVSSFFILSSDE